MLTKPFLSAVTLTTMHIVFQSDIHEDYCALCHRSGELLMCDTCNLVYHLQCLDPPLTAIPNGTWSCPKCKVRAAHVNIHACNKVSVQ